MKNIAIIQGHPDPAGGHLCHALADAYGDGAGAAGHKVTIIDVARIDFPLLRSQQDWDAGRSATPSGLLAAQDTCVAADHLVLIYPLWCGTMPALLKGFIEQVFRPGVVPSQDKSLLKGLMKGKSARIIVTMGMPVLAYRWYFRAHSLKNLQRNILGMVGIKPARSSLFGMVENANEKKRQQWFDLMRTLGGKAI